MSRGRARNWDKQRVRAIQQRRGSEPVTGPPPQVLLQANPPPRRRPSKAQLRVEAEQALAEWKARAMRQRGSHNDLC
jgi:hypothetical protein